MMEYSKNELERLKRQIGHKTGEIDKEGLTIEEKKKQIEEMQGIGANENLYANEARECEAAKARINRWKELLTSDVNDTIEMLNNKYKEMEKYLSKTPKAREIDAQLKQEENLEIDKKIKELEEKKQRKLATMLKYQEIGDDDRASEFAKDVSELDGEIKGLNNQKNENIKIIDLNNIDKQEAIDILKEMNEIKALAKKYEIELKNEEITKGESTQQTQGATKQEAPAKEEPKQEAPAQETPAQEAPAQEAPAQETPAQEAPAQEAPAQEAPAQEAPAQETPAQEAPAQEAPAQEAPAQGAPVQGAPVQGTPVQGTPINTTSEQITGYELSRVKIIIGEDGKCGTDLERKQGIMNYIEDEGTRIDLSDNSGLDFETENEAGDKYVIREINNAAKAGRITSEEKTKLLENYRKLFREDINEDEKEEIKEQLRLVYNLKGLTKEQRAMIEPSAKQAKDLNIAEVKAPWYVRAKWGIQNFAKKHKWFENITNGIKKLGAKAVEALPQGEKESESVQEEQNIETPAKKEPIVPLVEVDTREVVGNSEPENTELENTTPDRVQEGEEH